MSFLNELKRCKDEKNLPEALVTTFTSIYETYTRALLKQGISVDQSSKILQTFLELVVKQVAHPYEFETFHERSLIPFNYQAFGLDFFRPLIDFNNSQVQGQDSLSKISEQLKKKENVILFANHQTEPDPQIINLLLEKAHPQLAQGMIFVAGQRVVKDPMAVPFSLGCNLLCIYSKKYIDHPPELKEQKQLHNQRTMKMMAQMLAEGGKCIYVAPSGGRDRQNAQGKIEIDPFDPQSIEMFWLMAKQAEHPTHFYPLALSTYHLTPPPAAIQKELGEHRELHFAPAHLVFGQEIDMENFPGSEEKDKKVRRQNRADYIYSLVKTDYDSIA